VQCERIFIDEEDSLFTHFECGLGSAHRVWNASTSWLRLGFERQLRPKRQRSVWQRRPKRQWSIWQLRSKRQRAVRQLRPKRIYVRTIRYVRPIRHIRSQITPAQEKQELKRHKLNVGIKHHFSSVVSLLRREEPVRP
jgi:hypothetical protein